MKFYVYTNLFAVLYSIFMHHFDFTTYLMMLFFNVYRYQAPYASAFALGIVGSLIYFLAIVCPKGNIAIGAILIGR